MSTLCVRWAIGLAALLIAPAVQAGEPGGLGGGDELAIPVWRILAAFLFCAGMAWVVILVLRKRGGAGGLSLSRSLLRLPTRTRRIEVVETRRLSPHADVSLVREGDDEYLILLFAGGCEVLRSGTTQQGSEKP